MAKKITVVTRVKDSGQYLPEIMDCLADQTTEDFDWLLVDDNSTDEFTLQLLTQIAENVPDTTLIKQAGLKNGPGATYKLGLQEATGDYILVLDAADKITPTYLEKAAALLDENPQVGVVYGQAILFGVAGVLRQLNQSLDIPAEIADEQPVEAEWVMPEYQFPEILSGNLVFNSALFRRADYLATAGYSEELDIFQDFDLWLSLTELALERKLDPNRFFYRLPEVVYYRRSQASGYSVEQYVNSYVQIYRRHKALFNANIKVIFDKLALLVGMR